MRNLINKIFGIKKKISDSPGKLVKGSMWVDNEKGDAQETTVYQNDLPETKPEPHLIKDPENKKYVKKTKKKK